MGEQFQGTPCTGTQAPGIVKSRKEWDLCGLRY